MRNSVHKLWYILLISFFLPLQNSFAQLRITSSIPQREALQVPLNSNIVLNFDRDINSGTVEDNILVRGSLFGTYGGLITVNANTLTFNPDRDFIPGETVEVSLASGLQGVDGTPVAAPQTFRFYSRVEPSYENPPEFALGKTDSTISNFTYHQAADFDGDGDLDYIFRTSFSAYYVEGLGNGNLGEPTRLQYLNDTDNPVNAFLDGFRFVDLDQDDNMDFIAWRNSVLFWYRNEGGGQLRQIQLLPNVLSGITDVLTVDLDADGDLDIVTRQQNQNRIAWLENDGSQNFTENQITINVQTVFGFDIGDLNQDGFPDIVTSSSSDGKISWFRNDANQTFSETIIYSQELLGNRTIQLRDMDGDQDLDIIYHRNPSGSANDNIIWIENDNLSFVNENVIFQGLLYDFRVNDADGDGDLDVLINTNIGQAYRVSWMIQESPSYFEEEIIYETEARVNHIETIDISGDGRLDVLFSRNNLPSILSFTQISSLHVTSVNPRPNEVNIARNSNFQIVFDQAVQATSINSQNIQLRSERRGELTWTFTGGNSNTITIVPDEDFLPGEEIELTLANGLQSNTSPDTLFNGQNYVYRVASAPSPESPPQFVKQVIDSLSLGASRLFPADLDGDGDIDLVSTKRTNVTDDEIAWFENDGNQQFTKFTITNNADRAREAIAADIDQDGDLDIISVSELLGRVSWFENDGTQNFSANSRTVGNVLSPRTVEVSDIDGDGDMDVLAGGDRLTLFINDGNENFTTRDEISARTQARLGDLDGDGVLELVYSSGRLIRDKLGNYIPIGFPSLTNNVNTNGVHDFSIGDIDKDGDNDVVLLNSTSLEVFLNQDSLGFETVLLSSNFNNDRGGQIHLADIDGDGDLDILATSAAQNKLVWLENFGNLNFVERTLDGNSQGSFGVHTVDMDGDGDLDVLSSEFDSGKFVWYINDNSLTITNFNPAPFTAQALRDASIQVIFEQNIDPNSVNVNNFEVMGDISGPIACTYSVNDTVAIAQPQMPLKAGERIRVILRNGIVSAQGNNRLPRSFEYTFTVQSDPPEDNPAYWEEQTITNTNFSYAQAVDIDQDGDLDILTGGRKPINWFENDNGVYTQNDIAANVSGPIFPADIDQDGDLDFLAGESNKLAWYENDGNENFIQIDESEFFLPSSVSEIRVVDIDGDGDFDFFAAGFVGSYWLENDGSQDYTLRTITIDRNDFFELGDIDLDGDLDMISTRFGELRLYENDGKQNFESRMLATGISGHLEINDLDLDGDADIILATSTNSNPGLGIFLLENDGRLNFTSKRLSTTRSLETFVRDVDGDGDPDILSRGNFQLFPSGTGLGWYENLGGLSFKERFIAIAGNGIFPADVDNDSDLDVLDFGSLAWYVNSQILDLQDSNPPANAQGVSQNSNIELFFDEAIDVTNPLSEYIQVYGELSGYYSGTFSVTADTLVRFDPDQDFKAGELVRVYISRDLPAQAGGLIRGPYNLEFRTAFSAQNGVTSFSPRQITVTVDNPQESMMVDIDGDGDLDAISVSLNDGKVTWHENDGSQGFTENVINTIDIDQNFSITAGDIDRDGDMDLLATSFRLDNVYMYYNDGNENFTETVLANNSFLNGARDVQVADMNSDGWLDIIVAAEVNNAVYVYYNLQTLNNQGFVNFNARNSLTALEIRDLYISEINKDGFLDIIFTSVVNDEIRVGINDGNATPAFVNVLVSDSINGPSSVFAADIDKDGDNDIVTTSFFDDQVIWLENLDTVNLAFRKYILASDKGRAQDAIALDFDGDADVDILAASESNNQITWFINDASQNFAEQAISNSASGVNDIFIADVDGDGDADVVSSLSVDDEVTWFENIRLGIVNNPPQLSQISVNIPEDTPFDFTLVLFEDQFIDNDPGDQLDSLRIESLPQNGTLFFNNVALTQSLTLDRNQVANLRYEPNPNYNGNDAFEWNARDGELFSATGSTVQILINPVNDAPSLQDINLNVNKNNTLFFSESEFRNAFVDNDADPPATLRIVSLPSSGALFLGGNLVQAGDPPFLASQVGSLTYEPIQNFLGGDSFEWTASDGQLLAPNPALVNISVLNINNPPVVSTFGKATQEDAPLSFTLNDFVDNYSDLDQDPLNQIRISISPLNGSLLLNATVLLDGDVVNQADLVNLVYQPNTSFSGTDIFAWEAFDGLDFSNEVANVEINIISVNDVPQAGNFNLATNEDNPVTFFQNSFFTNYTDEDLDPLDSVQISQLPSNGILLLGQATLSLNDRVDSDDLDILTYLPNQDFFGNDSFNWRAFDGEFFSANEGIVNITVNPINDPPLVNQIDVSVERGQEYTFSASDFLGQYQDVDNDALESILISSPPTNGVLFLGTQPITSNNFPFSLNQATNLVYRPNAQFVGNDVFFWRGFDGQAFSNQSARVRINVIASNNPPFVSNFSVSISETDSIFFQTSDFSGNFTDLDNGDQLESITITDAPANGTLFFNNTAITTPLEVQAANIDQLMYVPNDVIVQTNDVFLWLASDGRSNSDNFAQVLIQISPVVSGNNPPVLTNATLSVDEDQTLTFTQQDFLNSFSDVDPGDQLELVRIVNLPSASSGQLLFSGNPITVPFDILLSDLGQLVYQPNPDFEQSDSFLWTARDASAFANSPANFLINVNPVNDPPQVQNFTLQVDVGNTLNFQSANFGANIQDPDFSDSPESVTILRLPQLGTLSLGATPVTPNQVISFANLSGLNYVPNAGAGNSLDSLQWTASDGDINASPSAQVFINIISSGNQAPVIGVVNDQVMDEDGTLDVQINLSDDQDVNLVNLSASSSNASIVPDDSLGLSGTGALRTLRIRPRANLSGAVTITIRAQDGQLASSERNFNLIINPVNDPPVIQEVSLNTNINTDYNFQNTDFLNAYSDLEGNALDRIRIQTLPQFGNLLLNGNAVNVNDNIVLQDISSLVYRPDNAFVGTDEFTWNASDGSDFASQAQRVVMGVASLPPTIQDITGLSINEEDTLVFSLNDFTSVYQSATPLDRIRIDKVPAQGVLRVNGNLINNGDEILRADLDALQYIPNSSFFGVDQIDWNASNGNQYASNGAQIIIQVNPVNDIPELSDLNFEILVNSEFFFSANSFGPGFLDADGDPIDSLVFLTGPSQGRINRNGNPLLNFPDTLAREALGELTYVPNPDYVGADSFTWTASDGQAFAQTSATVNFDVRTSIINQPPRITTLSDQTVLEDNILDLPIEIIDENPNTVNVRVLSSNTQLLPDQNMILSGLGANRNLRLVPAPNQNGTVRITLNAVDQEGQPAQQSFLVSVVAQDDAPIRVFRIPDIQVLELSPSNQISLRNVFEDIDNEDDEVNLSVFSNSNPSLVQAQIEGDFLLINYPPGQVGRAEIIIQAESNGLFARDTLGVRVLLRAPLNLVVSTLSQSSLLLNWLDESQAETGYQVQRALNADFNPVVAEFNLDADLSEFEDVNLSPNTSYFYRIRAFVDGDTTAFSNPSVATTLAVPARPSELNATLQGNEVLLSWIDNADNESGYRLERASLLTGNNFVEIASLGPNITATVNSGLQANLVYRYRVRAINQFGNSAYSNVALIEIPANDNLPRPPAPRSLEALSVSESQIDLRWQYTEDTLTRFVIQRTQVTNFIGARPEDIDTVGILLNNAFSNTKEFRDDRELRAGRLYYYRIYATNEGGDSNPSSIDSAFAICNLSQVLVAVRDDPGGDNEVICNGKSASLTLARKINDAEYQWRLNALPIQGAIFDTYLATETGVYDCVVSVGTDSSCIDTTLNSILVIVQGDPPNMSIRYQDDFLQASIRDASVYQWYRNGEAVPGANTYFYEPALTGVYYVTATFGEGAGACSATSNSLPFPDLLTASEGEDLSQYIQVSPNPVRDKIFVQLSSDRVGAYSLDLIDVHGKRYRLESGLEGNLLHTEIDISDFAKGIYVLELRTERGVGRKRVFKY